jgi:hypothetical protein
MKAFKGTALLLMALSAAVGGFAEQVQRSAVTAAGGFSSGSGQKLEISLGQAVSIPLSESSHIIYSGHLNTNHAPGTVTDLAALGGPQESQVELSWTSVGADGAIGQAAQIIVKISTQPITTQALFEAASTYAVLTPLPAGGFETEILSGLRDNVDYFIAVEARDAAKNQGALSNLASTQTFITPPADITDLAASSGASGGEAALAWTSPGDDGNTGMLNPGQYRIDYSTNPAHVFTVTNYQTLIATVAAAGSAQSGALPNLIGNATYYFGIFTGDDLPAFSGPSNTASVLTRAYAPGAAPFSNVSSTTLTANWTLNNNRAGTEFFVELSTDPGFGSLWDSQGWITTTSATFSNLLTNTYYVRVKARNSAFLETPYTELGFLEISGSLAPPLGITALAGDERIQLSWNPVLSGSPTGIRIYRSTVGAGPFEQVAVVPIDVTSFLDKNVENGITYYYVLKAFSGAGQSLVSVVVSAKPGDSLSPQAVTAIQGLMQDTVFTMAWLPTLYNVDGSTLTDLKEYRVYRTLSLEGAPSVMAVVSATDSLAYSDAQGAALAPAWYFVRPLDRSGNEGPDSPWVQSASLSPGVAFGQNDGRVNYFWVAPERRAFVHLDKPTPGVLSNNDVVVLWRRYPEEENGRVAASYELIPVKAATGKPAPGFVFPAAQTNMTFRYTPRGTGPVASNTVFRPKDLAVFVHNGIEFAKLGGDVDPVTHSISVVSRLPGKYIVKQTLRADHFILVQTVPRKVFTPNGDGINDVFQIYFENPKDSVVSTAKVYDITGAEVSDLKLGLTGNSYIWDGRDRTGGTAKGGVYFYQIQAEGKSWTGTIAVAK